MGETTKIEWCHHTFNPWIGCTKVSPACDHCYAEALMDTRWGKVKWGAGQPRVQTSPANWREPIRWNEKAFAEGVRHRVFCASLADVFDIEVPDKWRLQLMELISVTESLDWLLLTKRPQVAKKFFADYVMLDNIWVGTTVEDQKMADLRIPVLRRIPAKIHFLSCEPLLGPIDLSQWTWAPNSFWVIAGGESGRNARPSHPDWYRSLRDQCAAAGRPFFFKQWGEWVPSATVPVEQRLRREVVSVLLDGAVREWQPDYPDARLTSPEMASVCRIGKKAAGALLDGQLHREFPT